jgi:hypothetical protein
MPNKTRPQQQPQQILKKVQDTLHPQALVAQLAFYSQRAARLDQLLSSCVELRRYPPDLREAIKQTLLLMQSESSTTKEPMAEPPASTVPLAELMVKPPSSAVPHPDHLPEPPFSDF